MPRKPLDSWVFSLLHLCAPVLPKGIIFASGALFVGAGRGPRLSSGRGITKLSDKQTIQIDGPEKNTNSELDMDLYAGYCRADLFYG